LHKLLIIAFAKSIPSNLFIAVVDQFHIGKGLFVELDVPDHYLLQFVETFIGLCKIKLVSHVRSDSMLEVCYQVCFDEILFCVFQVIFLQCIPQCISQKLLIFQVFAKSVSQLGIVGHIPQSIVACPRKIKQIFLEGYTISFAVLGQMLKVVKGPLCVLPELL
jgi:hypothetical protein